MNRKVKSPGFGAACAEIARGSAAAALAEAERARKSRRFQVFMIDRIFQGTGLRGNFA